MIRIVFAAAALLLLIWAPAGAAPLERDRDQWSLNDVLRRGAGVLNDVLTEGLAALDDHLDVDVRTRRGATDGERATRFRFNIFPKGKVFPAERYGIEGTLRYSDETPSSFDFHLDLIEPSRLNRDLL